LAYFRHPFFKREHHQVMSVIQNIRDKYARWAVIAIALSLVGFIMMDAFAGKGSFFNNRGGNTIGKVSGNTISRVDFDRKMQVFGARTPEEQKAGLIQNLWDYEVNNILVSEEAEKLGLTVTDKEMRDVLYGNNPPQFISQYFTDPNTGKFDGITAQKEINALLKRGTPVDQYNTFKENIELIRNQRLISKYMALMTNTMYVPKWYVEKRNAESSLLGKMSYVMVPYASIPDSTIKISDDEIKDYMKKHEEDYKKERETRSIEYVLFSTAPSAADSAAAKAEIEKLKPQFEAATDPATFIAQQSSSIPFDTNYYGKSVIQVPAKDSIFATPVGGVYGPYLDATNYVLAKVIAVRNLPDSVKTRHILIGTVNPQTGQPTLPDSLAKKRADSIAAAIRAGANFDSLAAKFSDDEGSKNNGGVYTVSSKDIQTQFVKEFGNYILFEGQPGESKVVKTQFGWHYIEVMKDINVEPHYKIAYLAKPIQPSPETDNQVQNIASMFAGDSRDYKSFNANYEKNVKPKGYIKQVAPDIDEMQFDLMGVNGSARSFIKKVFEADKGDVIGPESIPDNYVVAVVTDVTKPGLPSVASVRMTIEPILRNKKKAESIVKNIGQVTTLEQVSSKVNQPVQTLDSLRLSGGRTLGYEPKVLGAVFYPGNKGKVVTTPLVGLSGVYVIRVDEQSTTPVEAANVEERRKQLEEQMKGQMMQQMQYGSNPILEPLKKSAKIKDNRAEFY